MLNRTKKRLSCYRYKQRQETPWVHLIKAAKMRSKKKYLPFNLTYEWGKKIWTGKCSLTGLPFVTTSRGRPHQYSPSLDRIIPSKGYVEENCRFILMAINSFKGDGSDEEMFILVKKLAQSLPLD